MNALDYLKLAAHALETPGDFTEDELRQARADIGLFLSQQENQAETN